MLGDPSPAPPPCPGRGLVEDRAPKDIGLRNLPFHDADQNRIWLAIIALAQNLLALCARLALPATAALRARKTSPATDPRRRRTDGPLRPPPRPAHQAAEKITVRPLRKIEVSCRNQFDRWTMFLGRT
jgi:hypothetical protein